MVRGRGAGMDGYLSFAMNGSGLASKAMMHDVQQNFTSWPLCILV